MMTIPKTLLMLATVALSIGFAACSPTPPPQEAVTFPTTVVGSIHPLQFVMDKNNNTFEFKIVCQGTGKWQSIKLDVRTDTSTNNSSLQTKQQGGYSCKSDNKSVFSGALFRVDELKPGEKIDVYFEVVVPDGGAKTGLTFTVGEGGKLYLGDVVP